MQNYDELIFRAFYGLAGQSKIMDLLVVFFGSYVPYLMVIGVIIILFFESDWRKRLRDTAMVALSVILSWGIVTQIIHFFYFRPRPFIALGITSLIHHDNSPSFPSGHAAFFFALAFALFLANRKWGWLFIGLTLLMGIARVMAGVHWPLDIVAGILVSFLSVAVVKWALDKSPLK